MLAGEELVDEAVVEVEALGVGCAGALREDARPGDGEAVGLEAEGLHESDVFFVAVVVIVGDVAGVAVVGLAGGVGEGVPDGGAAAIFVDCAFDLIGGGGGAPEEAWRKGSIAWLRIGLFELRLRWRGSRVRRGRGRRIRRDGRRCGGKND